MRVAYVVTRFPSTTETFIAREMAALGERGVDVTLFALRRQRRAVLHPEAAGFTPQVPSLGQTLVAQLAWLTRHPGRLARVWWLAITENRRSPRFLARALLAVPAAAWFAIRVEEERIDHVHAHWATHSALAAWVVHRLTGRPFSITAHAHDIFVDQSMLGRKLDEATFIAVISEFNARYLTERYPDEVDGKLAVVHCGVDVDRYSASGRRETTAVTHVLCVASLQPYKGHLTLLDALALLPRDEVPLRVTLVGEGPLRASLERRVADLGLSDQVTFTGPLRSDAVAELLGQADAFVLPSVITKSRKMEGIPVALMEASAAGLPAVASDISGVPELILDGRTGLLVPPGDAAALAQALRRLALSPTLRREMGRQGRQHVQESFTVGGGADRLLDLMSASTSEARHG